MALDDIISRAQRPLLDALIRYARRPSRRLNYRDLWVTTSGNPCIFCRNMEQVSIDAIIFPGDPFPVIQYTMLEYFAATDITYANEPPAHRDCLCQRRSVPFTP